MRKTDSITFEIDKRDLEVVLGNLSLTIAKMERTQEALKEIVEIVRTALQEEEDPDYENCPLPCSHNLKSRMAEEEPDRESREILEQIKAASEAMENPKDISPIEEAEKNEDDEDEAESLAIELLKAVFSALTDVFENGE